MLNAILTASHVINIVHFISCILIILIIYKTNKFKDHQEQLLAFQNLAELLYEGVHIINTAPPLYIFHMPLTAATALSVTAQIFLTLSFQILAFLAIVLAFSITKALKYKIIVTKQRVYVALAIILLLDTFVSTLFFLPGIQYLEHVAAHVDLNEEDITVESNVIYLFVFCYQIIPPLIVQFVSFYKVSRFARWHSTGFISQRVKVYMRRAKLILAVCILLYISYIPHKVMDTFLHFAQGPSDIMNTVAMISSFLPGIYNVSKFPVFLLCYKPYRMTARALIWRTKNHGRIHPTSTC